MFSIIISHRQMYPMLISNKQTQILLGTVIRYGLQSAFPCHTHLDNAGLSWPCVSIQVRSLAGHNQATGMVFSHATAFHSIF